jgi:hypothetical protein
MRFVFPFKVQQIRNMAIHYAPSITPNNYAALEAIRQGRLPATYWIWRHAQDQRRRRLVAKGDTVVPVGVDADDLRAYCRAMKCQTDELSLGLLSIKLASERKIQYPFTPSGDTVERTRL